MPRFKILNKYSGEKMFKSISIKWKYMIYSVAIIIPFIMICYTLFYMMMNVMRDNNSRYTVQIMRQVNNNIEVMLKEMDNIALELAADVRVKRLLFDGGHQKILQKSVNHRLRDIAKRVGEYRQMSMDILIVTKDRYIASSTYEKWIGDYEILGFRWIDNILNTSGAKTQIGAYNVFKPEQVKNSRGICLSRGIMDENNNVQGLVMIEVDLEYINRICKDVGLGEKGFIAVLNENNQVLYHTNKSEIGRYLDVEMFRKVKDRDYNLGELGGERMLVTRMDSQEFGLKITGFIPLIEMEQNFQVIRRIAFLGGIGLILLLVLIFYTVVYGVTRPIIRIKNQMASVENGNFKIRIQSDRNDEIGQLEKGFNLMIKKINDLIETVYKVKIKEKEAQFNELSAKVNPHFLYNTLDAISMTAYLNNDLKVVTMINALADHFRASITNGQWLITIREEFEQLRNYLYLITIGKENWFRVTWDINEDLLNYQTVRCILQPIVENSLLHGFKDRETGGELYISIREGIGGIIFSVADNGAGMTTAKLEILSRELNEYESGDYLSKVGLKNLSDRIKLSFGVEYGLNIRNNETGGVTVEVNIPIMERDLLT
jgi:two-component system sensor histidine kinase YesM